MLTAIFAFLIGAASGYGFRGLIRKEIGKAGAAVQVGEKKIDTAVKEKL